MKRREENEKGEKEIEKRKNEKKSVTKVDYLMTRLRLYFTYKCSASPKESRISQKKF